MIQDEILKKLNIPLPNEGLLKAAEVLRSQYLPMDFKASMQVAEKFKQQLGIIDNNTLRDITEAYRRIMPLLDTPQFREIQKLERNMQTWIRNVQPHYAPSLPPEDGELCAAVDALIEKAQSQGVEEDALPDEKMMQDVIFVMVFYATVLAPEALNDWVAHIYETLKIQIHEAVNAAGSIFVSGVLNIYTLLGLCLYLASYLK